MCGGHAACNIYLFILFFSFQYIIKFACCYFLMSTHYDSVEIAFRNNIFFHQTIYVKFCFSPISTAPGLNQVGEICCIMTEAPLRKILWTRDDFIKRSALSVWEVLQQCNEVKKCSVESELH